MIDIYVILGVFVYSILLYIMVWAMHLDACNKSWTSILNAHQKEMSERLRRIFDLPDEELNAHYEISRLRYREFGLGTLDMDYLGYELWVKKMYDIGAQYVDRHFKHLL